MQDTQSQKASKTLISFIVIGILSSCGKTNSTTIESDPPTSNNAPSQWNGLQDLSTEEFSILEIKE